MSPRAELLKSITEAEWQGFVASYAQLNGWTVFHVFDSRRSNAGWPDLTCVRDGRVVFAELKSESGKVTQAQQWWVDELGKVAAASDGAVEAHIWRPSDENTVREVLGR